MAAENAIRQSEPNEVWQGLMALTIENFTFDPRDSMRVIVLLYHSAVKLGLNAEELFAKVAALAVDPYVGEVVREFPRRPSGSRSLGVFLWEALGEGDSFRYRRLGSDPGELL